MKDIRIEMSQLGWISKDQLTWMGWGVDKNGKRVYGYSIWFERWDWHGKRCDRVSYHAHTNDLDKIEETVYRAAVLAKEAWDKHPYAPPMQLVDGSLREMSSQWPGDLAKL